MTRLLRAAGTAAQVGLQPGHRRGLPAGDAAARRPGPGDVRQVAQFDERMILWKSGVLRRRRITRTKSGRRMREIIRRSRDPGGCGSR
jgi:hypothetical protein